ncbi:MAG: hypothetical protein IKZ02_03635 [Alphaproteobacteria bacterium]|nr:hypothetical protein [Alphaproteobacteria bacterium]
MKKTSILLAGFSLFAMTLTVSTVCLAQFGQVQPYVPEVAVVASPENYQEPLMKTLDIHLTQVKINNLINLLLPKYEEEEAKRQLLAEQVEAMTKCNIQNLSAVYSSPEDAWKNILEKYYDEIANLTIFINSAQVDAKGEEIEENQTIIVAEDVDIEAVQKKAEQAKLQDNSFLAEQEPVPTDEEEISEAYPYWRVARSTLEDVYANPEKYGALASVGTGFPLWIDQKYQYTKDVLSQLSAVQTKFNTTGVLGQETINATINQYVHSFTQTNGILNTLNEEENQKKYADLLKYLKDTHPNYDNIMSSISNATALPSMPDPLPPVYEYIQLMTDPAKTGTMFPEWPTPWARYIREGLTDRAEGGEMDTFFMPNSLTLREEVRNWDSTKINNRLAVYKEKFTELQNQKKASTIAKEIVEKQIEEINSDLEKYGITLSFDVSKPKLVQDELVKLKKELINKTQNLLKNEATYNLTKASDKLQKFQALPYEEKVEALKRDFNKETNPEEYSMAVQLLNASERSNNELFLKALEEDLNGEAQQTASATNNVQQNIESQKAQYALFEESAKEDKARRALVREQKIDALCINGGL